MANRLAIEHVTDTALWMAALRGAESQRADALFKDPLASMLAGDRGRQIARSFPRSAVIAWSVVIRTLAIDRLIQRALRSGVDTIVNVGAGLDTRPYRLPLQGSVRWIEIDHAAILDHKESVLVGQTPAHPVERVGLDLRDRSARRALLARCAGQARKGLVICEGVIPYFSNDEVEQLARDLLELSELQYWILDFDDAGARQLPNSWSKRLAAAPFLFNVPRWFRFFEDCGWHAEVLIPSASEAERVSRPYPFTFPSGLLMQVLPRHVRTRILSTSGAVMLARKPGWVRQAGGCSG